MKVLDNDLPDLEVENFSSFSTESETQIYDLKIDEIEPHPYNLLLFPQSTNFNKRIRTSKAYFSNFTYNNGKNVKKEYLRVQLIRGHNRAIKNALQGKTPAKTLNKIARENTSQLEKWEIFKAYTKKRLNLEDYLNGFSLMNCKSFNNNVCMHYFSDQDTRKSFGLYCNLIFCGDDSEKLCKKFNFKCCKLKNTHSDSCKLEWKGIENFIRYKMISELGVKIANE